MVGAKRRHLGLGGFPDVPLASARDKARKAREDIGAGIDPIAQRRATAKALLSSQVAETTFKQAAEAYIEAHGVSWKNAKHRAQWTNTLTTYAYPVIGELGVQHIGQVHVLKILESIWKSKTETAVRLRGRLEVVLDWATVRGYRQGENPARWKGHLDKLLAASGKIQKVEHHPAVPVADMPKFMAALRQREGRSARLLEFTILTAVRSGEARGASWAEITSVASPR
jgi:integrase